MRASISSLGVVVLVVACDAAPKTKAPPAVASVAPAGSVAPATPSTALERITSANVTRLERVRGYNGRIDEVRFLDDGSIVVDRQDELEILDPSGKLRRRVPVDRWRVRHGFVSAEPGAWVSSGDEIAVLTADAIVLHGADGQERGKVPLAGASTESRLLRLTRSRVVLQKPAPTMQPAVVILDRANGRVVKEIEGVVASYFSQRGDVAVFDHGTGDADLVGLEGERLSAAVKYPRTDGGSDGAWRTYDLAIAADGKMLLNWEVQVVNAIDVASSKSTRIPGTVLGANPWGDDKIAVYHHQGRVGVVTRSALTKVEWRQIPLFPCVVKDAKNEALRPKAKCDAREASWRDLRFAPSSATSPTLLGTTAASIVVFNAGKPPRVMSHARELVAEPILSPDGRYVIDFDKKNVIIRRIPDDATASEEPWPAVVSGEANHGVFSPDGRRVALFDTKSFKVYDVESGKVVVENVRPRPHLASGAPFNAGDLDEPILHEMFRGPREEGVRIEERRGALAVRVNTTKDPSSNTVKLSAAEIFDVRSGDVRWRVNVPQATRRWALDAPATRLAVALQASEEGYLLFDLRTSEPKRTIVPTGEWVSDIAFAGERILHTTNRSELHGRKDGKEWKTRHEACLKDSGKIDVAAAGTRAVVGYRRHCIFDTETGAVVAEVDTEASELARISHDRTELYAYGGETLFRWDVATGKSLPSSKVKLPAGMGRSRNPFVYTSDDKEIIVAAENAVVWLDRATGAERARLAWPGAHSVSLSSSNDRDKRLLAVTTPNGDGAVLDAQGAVRTRFTCPEAEQSFASTAWSADGRSLYCLSVDYNSADAIEARYVFVVPALAAPKP